MPDLTLETQYAEAMLDLRRAEGEVKDLKDRATLLEAQLLEQWANDGCNQIRVTTGDGGTPLLFLQETTFAQLPQGKDAAVSLLADGEFADLVQPTVNTNTLSALVRELKDEDRIPASWAGIIEPGSRFNIRVRK